MFQTLPTVNKQRPEPQTLRKDGALDVVKIFHTVQGEGPFAGLPAVFVRVAGCDLLCPLCDTNYTAGRHAMSADALVRRVQDLAGKHTTLIVLTGGEPFRQNVRPFVELAVSKGFIVQVETNGTLFVEDLPFGVGSLYVVCSPKTPQINLMLLPYIHCLKYVLTAGEVDDRDGLPTSTLGNGLRPRRPWAEIKDHVWVQPADCANKAQYESNVSAAVDSCVRFGYRLSLQLHKYIGLE